MIKNELNLAIIPARGGSKRIPNKNIKLFHGKPLIVHTIRQAIDSKIFDRIIVDTDSPKIASVARRYGAEAPFLRPAHLATDTASGTDAILFMLKRLEDEKGYNPDIVTVLQTTSPLREKEDIIRCAQAMKKPGITSVCTVCETHPRLYHLDKNGRLVLMNPRDGKSTNVQAWKKAYLLNGCMVYMIRQSRLIETKSFLNPDTVGVICEKWRSIDLDEPEDWVLAEVVFKNKKNIHEKLKRF